MTKRTPREEDLLSRAKANERAIYLLDSEWPQSRLAELSMTEQGRAIIASYKDDRKGLVATKAIIDAMMVDADGFAVLFELAAKKKWAFDSCVMLAKQELATKDQPAEKAA